MMPDDVSRMVYNARIIGLSDAAIDRCLRIADIARLLPQVPPINARPLATLGMCEVLLLRQDIDAAMQAAVDSGTTKWRSERSFTASAELTTELARLADLFSRHGTAAPSGGPDEIPG